MFLRFNCVLLVVMIFAAEISPLLLHGNARGGLFLGVCDMKYKSEATQMMVRSGATLMSGSGRNVNGRVGGKMKRQGEGLRRRQYYRKRFLGRESIGASRIASCWISFPLRQ
jgi:hypothetical protein